MKLSRIFTRLTSIVMAFALAISVTMIPHMQHSVSADIDSVVLPDSAERSLAVDSFVSSGDKSDLATSSEPVRQALSAPGVRLTEAQEAATSRLPGDRMTVTYGKKNLPALHTGAEPGSSKQITVKQGLPILRKTEMLSETTELREMIVRPEKRIGGNDETVSLVGGTREIIYRDNDGRSGVHNPARGGSDGDDAQSGDGDPEDNGDGGEGNVGGNGDGDPDGSEPTPSVTPTPAETPAPTKTPDPTATPTPTPVGYTYQSFTADMEIYNSKKVNVRDLPSTEGAVIGSLNEGDMVRVTGYCKETGWYRIDFTTSSKTIVAYVCNLYLRTKPMNTPTPTPTPKPTQTPTPTPTKTPEYTYREMDATYVVYNTNDILNVRSQPNQNGNKLGTLRVNAEVHVTGQCNETKWYRFDFVTANGTVTAYASNNYLREKSAEPTPTATPTVTPTPTLTVTPTPVDDNPQGTPTPIPTPTPVQVPTDYTVEPMDTDMYLSGSGVNVRSGPYVPKNGEAANKVGVAKEYGTKYHVTGKVTYRNDTWYQVVFDGNTAYINANYLVKELPSAGDDLIYKLFVVSAQHKDLPYWSGAPSWSHADCCGYIQILYKEVLGIDLGRTVQSQMQHGTKISWDEARPGDLVCTEHDPYTNGNHVGIYIGKVVDGRGQSHYYYISQSGMHIHVGYMEGSDKYGAYREQYAPYRVTNLQSSHSAQEIFDMLRNAGVRVNTY